MGIVGCSGADGAELPGEAGADDADGDAANEGGALDAPDALGSDTGDAFVDADARGDTTLGDATKPDAGAPCTVGSVPGVCVDVATCTGDYQSVPGHCSGPATIECCVPKSGDAGPPDDTSGWCPTDPSARPNAGLSEESGVSGCPSGMLPISEYCASPPDARNNVDISRVASGVCATGHTHGAKFCIDRFEASIVVRNPDGTESSWSPYYEPRASDAYRAVSLRSAVPQSYISGKDAKRACEASGKRLCGNVEWLRACRGLDNRIYPYGNTRIAGACNDESLHSLYAPEECFHTAASWIYDHLAYAGIDQQANTLYKTGSRAACITEDGVFDMMGNVHDWIYDPLNLTAPSKGVDFRGGFYSDTKINGEGCLYNTDVHSLDQVDYSVGFRCCADAPP